MPKNQMGGAFGHLPFGAMSVDKAKAEAERQKKMKKFTVDPTKGSKK